MHQSSAAINEDSYMSFVGGQNPKQEKKTKPVDCKIKGILITELVITVTMWLAKALFVAYILQGITTGSKESVEHAAHHPVKTDHFFADGEHNKEFDHEAVLGEFHFFSIFYHDQHEKLFIIRVYEIYFGKRFKPYYANQVGSIGICKDFT